VTPLDPARARGQALLREAAGFAGAGEHDAPRDMAPQLGEILYRIIDGAICAMRGDHRAAARKLKMAARALTLAIARAEQLAAKERMPRR